MGNLSSTQQSWGETAICPEKLTVLGKVLNSAGESLPTLSFIWTERINCVLQGGGEAAQEKKKKRRIDAFWAASFSWCHRGIVSVEREIFVFCGLATPVVDKGLHKSSCLSNKENSVSCLCDITNICQVYLEVISMQLCPSTSCFQLGFNWCLCSALISADFPLCIQRILTGGWKAASRSPKQLPCLLYYTTNVLGG